MSSFVDRVVGALKADVRIFEEIEADKTALPQAMIVVAGTVLASGIGSLNQGVMGVVAGLVGGLLGWVLGAAVIYLIGVHVMPEPTTRADIPELMRVLGFGAAPSLLRVFGIIPFVGWIVTFAAAVWGLYVYVVAVRQALDYQSTGRAVAVCVIAMVVNLLIFCGFGMLVAGMAAVGGAVAS